MTIVTSHVEELGLGYPESDLTQYHEAGHAVAFYLHDFRPKRITGPRAEVDRRSTAFFRTLDGFLVTPLARARAQDYAVCCIAGIVAESKFGGVPLPHLRETSGRGDYRIVHSILNQLMLSRGSEFGSEMHATCIRLWELRAVTLVAQSNVWDAVESVSAELEMSCGELEREDLVAAIKRGLHQGSAARAIQASTPDRDALLVSGHMDEGEARSPRAKGVNAPISDLVLDANRHQHNEISRPLVEPTDAEMSSQVMRLPGDLEDLK